MALGSNFCSNKDMEFAVEQVLQTAEQEGSREIRADHARADGWYSSEAIAAALTTTSMKKRGRVEYTMSLKPLYKHPEEIHSCVGAVVNVDDRHWVAIRSQGGEIWLLDSQECRPIRMTREAYNKFVAKRRAAYPIHWATDMSQPPSSAAASSSASSQTPVLPLESQSDTMLSEQTPPDAETPMDIEMVDTITGAENVKMASEQTPPDAERPVDIDMVPAEDVEAGVETGVESVTMVSEQTPPNAGAPADIEIVSSEDIDAGVGEVASAPPAPLGQTRIPVLMVAEQISPDDAQDMIFSAHLQRGYELEALALEARSEYMAALQERGGH